jgi:hypothetical protein
MHKSKQPGIILKLDYEKAYGSVNLDFILEILESRGFGETWIGWTKKIMFGGSINILANGEDSNTFMTGRGGVRQEDPLSPLLFNLVGDALTRMLARVANNNLVKRVLDHFRPGGLYLCNMQMIHFCFQTVTLFTLGILELCSPCLKAYLG